MSDPFDAPAIDPATDEAPPRPGPILVGAAVLVFFAGVMGSAYALQLLVFIRWYDWGGSLPLCFGGLGLVQILLAAFVARGAALPTAGALALGLLQLLLAVGWTGYAIYLTLFSPLGLCWLLTCVPPLLLLPVALPRAWAISTARRKLYRD